MMKWRAIVGAAGLVGALVVLHVLFFSSRIAAWNQMEATALQNVAKYKEIVGDAKLSLFNDTVLRNWLREKEKEIATTKESFDQIRTNYPLVILPESDVSADYTMVLFNETIKRLDALEKFENSYRANPDQGVPYDRVRVLDDLDVKSSMAPGRFGMGFSTRLLRFPVYYLPMYYQKDPGAFPKQGAIEFFFKPDDWSTPDDRRARSLFYARGPDRVRPSLIPGAQNVYRPEITIYKDAASMLHFEITDIDGNGAIAQPGFLDAQNGFSPQRFTYVSCVWNGNVLRMYVNGRDITGQGAPMTPPGLLGYGTEGMIGVGAGGARDRIRAMMGGGYGMEMGPPGTYPGGPQPAAPPSSGRGPELLEFASLGLGGAYTDPFQNQADGVFDDLRIKKVGQPSPPPTAGGAPIPGTMFLDTFEGELVSREELNSIIDSIGDNLRFIRTTSDPSAQRPYIDKMENLRACCGLSTARLATLHPSVAFVRRVHIFRELNRITGRSLNELFRTFCWLPPQEVRNPHYEIPQPTRDDMETYVGFLQLSLELLQDAMREDVRVDRVTAVSLEGEDLFPDYAQLEASSRSA
ncbi:hypothetical protein HS125_02115 [bacterium]|nr:hypothetical protein [bacterium]